VLRHRPINNRSTRVMTPRSSAHPSQVLPRSRKRPHDEALIDELTRQAPDTDRDEQIAPSTRSGAVQRQSPLRGSRFHPRNWPPFAWVGATLLVVVIGYLVSTVGLAWFSTFVDPGKYGPTHGNIVTGVFGGGDSLAQQSKLIGLNDGGRVEVIMLHAGDANKAEFLTGPNLVTSNFPDPLHANVDLTVGDVDHDGNQDVTVAMFSTIYDKPFNRYGQAYILYGDGQGHLKRQQQ
jgi:hypothetical protein